MLEVDDEIPVEELVSVEDVVEISVREPRLEESVEVEVLVSHAVDVEVSSFSSLEPSLSAKSTVTFTEYLFLAGV